MRAIALTTFCITILFQVSAQDYLSTQGSTLPGTVTLSDGKTVTGKVSYSAGSVSVQPEASPVTTYPAAEVTGFVLESGGEFISIASGKKARSSFYETASYKNPKLMLVKNATSVDERGKEKDQYGIKIVARYYFYAAGEKQLLNADLKEISAFLKTRCEGITKAITEYKDKTYHYGAMANDEEKMRKHLRIIDDYINNRCTYIPKDY